MLDPECVEQAQSLLCINYLYIAINWMLTVAVLHNYLTCTGGVLLVRANVVSSRSFIRLAMFKLELEWTVGVDGAGEGQKDACTKRLLKCQTSP